MAETKFNTQQLTEIKQFLNSRNRQVCCFSPKLEVLDDVFKLPLINSEAQDMEAFAVVCDHCGQTNLYSVEVFKNAKKGYFR